MNIGNRIKLRRKEIGMTQEALATKLGFSNKSSISMLEKGTRDLDIDKLVECAKALDTSVDYLLGIQPHIVTYREHDDLCTAYEHADKETQLVIRRILGIKKEAPPMSGTSMN